MVFERDALRIHYHLAGDPDGPPVLLLAPGGLRSGVAWWSRAAYNPLKRLTGFRLIAMDQRNAGSSWAPISATDGWDAYTADQLALLDHLGVDQFHILGMCIGGPFAFGLIRAAPSRVGSVVLLQPIGLDNNRAAFFDLFDGWAAEVLPAHPEATPAALASFKDALFSGDFVFNASPAEVAASPVPLLIGLGDDKYHPESISREVARLAPRATLVEDWKTGQIDAMVQRFLEG